MMKVPSAPLRRPVRPGTPAAMRIKIAEELIAQLRLAVDRAKEAGLAMMVFCITTSITEAERAIEEAERDASVSRFARLDDGYGHHGFNGRGEPVECKEEPTQKK